MKVQRYCQKDSTGVKLGKGWFSAAEFMDEPVRS